MTPSQRFQAAFDALCCLCRWDMSSKCPRNLLHVPNSGPKKFAHRMILNSLSILPRKASGLSTANKISRMRRPWILDLRINLVFLYKSFTICSNTEYRGLDTWNSIRLGILPFVAATTLRSMKKQSLLLLLWVISDPLLQSLNMGSSDNQNDATKRK